MLSYQHGYHAGNLPDVHKHAALAVILSRLCEKPKPLSYMETHAGRALYDLAAAEALKTGEAARSILEAAGLQVAVCADFAGRILDRLIRPFYNEALTRLDEGLATAADMDLTVKLGLGYPEGPIELLERTGLQHHHDVTKALFEVYGTRHYAPARRSVVAKRRAERDS